MNQCQNCGQLNSPESNFCRSCGTQFARRQPSNENTYEYSPPRPYSWKTDEFQTQAEARKTATIDRVQPLGAPHQPPAPLAHQQRAQPVAHGYRCPNCGSNHLPIVERKVSTAGWIVFALLLVFTWIFFWIGLLMKEDVSICPVCRARVGK